MPKNARPDVQPADDAPLTIPQAARSIAFERDYRPIARQIRADVASGAPLEADGRIRLGRYAAWLLREGAGGQ